MGDLNDGNFCRYYLLGESTKFYCKKVILHALENLECDKIKCFSLLIPKMSIMMLFFAQDLCEDSIK